MDCISYGLEVKFITNRDRSPGGTKLKYIVICEIMEHFGLECDTLKMHNLYCTIMIENEASQNFQVQQHINIQKSIKCRRNNAEGKGGFKMDIRNNSSHFSKFLQKEEYIKLKWAEEMS